MAEIAPQQNGFDQQLRHGFSPPGQVFMAVLIIALSYCFYS
jgi:hypothetical protein